MSSRALTNLVRDLVLWQVFRQLMARCGCLVLSIAGLGIVFACVVIYLLVRGS
jgi:hypothetical protein